MLGPRVARAQAVASAKRLVVFFSPNGTIHSKWRPSGTGASFTFPAGSILEPLAAHRADVVVVDGLDFIGTSNHEGGMAAMLTGGGSASSPTAGASIDQYVAGRIGAESRFASLELGVQTSAWGGSVQTRMSYRRAGELVPPDDRPDEVYRRLFGEVAGTPSAADALLRKRKSVLDLVRAELGVLKRAVGAEEGQKLDRHLDALRAVENGLSGGTGVPAAACTPPVVPRIDAGANDHFPDVTRVQTDLLVAALACGATKVASLQCSHTVSPTVFSWTGSGDGHHSLSHSDDGNAAGVAAFVAAERWFTAQFSYLLDRLAALPEPGAEGSMLDHTLVVWAKELGDARLHECRAVPFVLAGRAGGRLTPGRYLRYSGLSHTKLLVSICHAMGLDDVTSFGDLSHGTGALEGLLG
ncbi:DUF1552 domain-containing protein [Myxococcota bacterium]|nr:DUF1552 domain-containing protein [Myxococcota bacterium]